MNKLEINLAYSFAPRFERRRGMAAASSERSMRRDAGLLA